MSRLSPGQRDEFEAVFKTFDSENRGSLSREQCAMAMRSIGYDLSSSDVRDCDLNGFLKLVESVSTQLVDKEPMLREALRPFDVSGRGEIDMQTLQWFLTSLGEPLNADEMRSFERDLGGGGRLTIDEVAKRLAFKS